MMRAAVLTTLWSILVSGLVAGATSAIGAMPISAQEIIAPSGLKIWLSPDPQADDVTIIARFRGGFYGDAVPGATAMAEAMLFRGVEASTPVEFWKKFPALGGV